MFSLTKGEQGEYEQGKREQGNIDNRIFGEKVGLIWMILGCQHDKLSRPFTREKVSYRTCLDCGAVTPFNEDTFETFGEFYYPPIVRKISEV